MNAEAYSTLSPKEKLMYDELHAFAARVAQREEEIIELLKTLIAMAHDPI